MQLRTWDRLKLAEFFTPIDIESILKIPLCTRQQEDFWAWHFDSKGVFSVRSAYRMLVTYKEHATAFFEHSASGSDTRAEQKEWLGIWKLEIPSKIRVFLWRLFRHSLPTGDVRYRRNVAAQSSCTICGAQDSWKHALFECNLARCVWALEDTEVTEHLASVMEEEGRRWWVAAGEALPRPVMVRVAVTMWAIWYARRKAIFEESYQSPLSTHCFIDRFVADLELPLGDGQTCKEAPDGSLHRRE